MIKSGDHYKHIKSGNYYIVELLAIDKTNECEFDVVVYSPINKGEIYYTRELDQFLERFEKADK